MKIISRSSFLLTILIYFSCSFAIAAETKDEKYFVMIGDTGVGKSTIYEKITGKSGLSGQSAMSFTRDSRVGFVDGIIIADTPGTTSKGYKLAHALQILGALRYRPITSLVFIVTIADRIDATIAKVSNVIRPFYEFDDISVIITKHDSQSWIDKGQLKEEIKSIGVANVYISSNESKKSDYLRFLKGINYKPVTILSSESSKKPNSTDNKSSVITLNPTSLNRYFNLTEESERKKSGTLDNYIRVFKEIVDDAVKEISLIADMQKKIDMTFSFNAELSEYIIYIQEAFADELGLDLLDTNDTVWSMELGYRLKKELLVLRRAMDLHQKNADKDGCLAYRKCPFCDNVFILAERCDGETTCGNLPKTGDSRREINIFTWKLDWKSILSNGFSFNKHTLAGKSSSKAKQANSNNGKSEQADKTASEIKEEKKEDSYVPPCGRTISFKDMAPITKLPDSWKDGPNANDVPEGKKETLENFASDLEKKYKGVAITEDKNNT